MSRTRARTSSRRSWNSVTFSELEVIRKGLRIRMGRIRAEIAEGAEVCWEGGKGTYIGAVFNNCLGQLNRYH
jgi:hypothetical protein